MRPTTLYQSRRALFVCLFTVMDERRQHKRSIRISYPTPSREGIVISVHQTTDAMGNWLAPTCTISRALPEIIENGTFLRDLGRAIEVASYFFDQMESYVVNDDARVDETRQKRKP